MRIQAINANIGNANANQKNTQFKGIWIRLGENYLDHSLYHGEGFYHFTNGKQELAKKMYKGAKIEILGSIDLTVEEGDSAYKFLFNKVQNSKGYQAVKKLRAFMQTKSIDNQHNIMFLEKEDCADPTKERGILEISAVNAKILEYEEAHNIVNKPATALKKEPAKPLTTEEFRKMISENGVA